MRHGYRPKQKGMVLLIGLVLLLLFTLLISGALRLSNTNLRLVGNLQTRQELLESANIAIEQVLASDFTSTPQAEQIDIDLNDDGINEYTVNIDVPKCIRAIPSASGQSEIGLSLTGGGAWWTVLTELRAVVQDKSSGGSVTVRYGSRVLMSNAQKMSFCP